MDIVGKTLLFALEVVSYLGKDENYGKCCGAVSV